MTIKTNRRGINSWGVCLWAAAFVMLICSAASHVSAQDKKKAEELPTPKNITEETKDGVYLHFTYLASTKGKEAVPVIMLHGWKGQRAEYNSLALGLQRLGRAVVTLDLRGHGRSKRARDPKDRSGEITIDTDRMRKADFLKMVAYDMEVVKKFLRKENNEGKLNLEMLTVVGADMGALVALNWAAADWSAPSLRSYKQGQDVKALVLLSPEQSFKGITARAALAHPVVRGKLSIMIVVGGEDSKSLSNAKRINSTFKRYHPEPDEEDQAAKQDLFFIELDTSLQGVKLLDRRLDTAKFINTFIQLRLHNRRDTFPWTERVNPLAR